MVISISRCVKLGILLAGLSIGTISAMPAQNRFGFGVFMGSGELPTSLTFNDAFTVSMQASGLTFGVTGVYEVPLNESGLNLVVMPSIFNSTYSGKTWVTQPWTSPGVGSGSLSYNLELTQSLWGIRVPILLSQEVGQWSFAAGPYLDYYAGIKVKYSTFLLGSVEFDVSALSNSTSLGLIGHVGYDFGEFNVSAGVVLPFTDISKDTKLSTKPVLYQVGLVKML